MRDTGTISNDLHAVENLIARLRKTHGKVKTKSTTFEAVVYAVSLKDKIDP